MAKRKVLGLKFVSFYTSVRIPVSDRVFTYTHRDFERWERYFVGKRDSAKTIKAKQNYDECRATIEWARKCNGKLEDVINCGECYDLSVKFTFSFYSVEDLRYFAKTLQEKVKNETLK